MQKTSLLSKKSVLLLILFYLLQLFTQDHHVECSNVQLYSDLGTTKCPSSWVGYGDSCYKFIRSYSATFSNATLYCMENYNAKLLSVNNFDENDFILNWLQDNDPYKRLWLTSAVVTPLMQNNWIWAGDLGSKFINNNDLWLPVADRTSFGLFNGAAYAFSQAAYKWGLLRVDSNKAAYSFICEYANKPSNGLAAGLLMSSLSSSKDRGLDYGLANIHDPSLVPRGPRIIVEPKDVVFDISGRSHSNQLKLKCVADAHPRPVYTWYKEDYSTVTGGPVGVPINVLDDERMTQTDGQLTIYNPNQQTDKGKYYCAASNEFGRVVSQTVSITFYWILEFNKKRSIERGRENWGKSVSCDAPQHHSEVLYYWTKAEFPNFVQQDRRVFISYDGNLYFSSLEKIDRSNYSCQIQSLISSTGRFGPSFALVVEPASSAQKLQFANGFPKIFPESPMAGQDLRLECMAYGYPTPVYNWTRASPTQRLPAGHQFKNDGKVLLIPKARIEDEGEYVCRASSEGDTLTKTVRVIVQAAPTFTQPLENQVLGEREPLSWECEAFGIPKLTYSWYKNGEEIIVANLSPLDAGRYQIRDNRFTIDSVQGARDQGMYQCRAANQHGASFSTGQLRIANFKPVDRHPLPLHLFAQVDTNITIPCYIEAIPRPVITWRKEGIGLADSQIDRSRIRVLPNGLLQITRTRIGDSGTYECLSDNQQSLASSGPASSRTWLIIRPAPVILDPMPRRDIVTYGDPLKVINCDISSSDNNDVEIVHVWLKNGLPIDFDAPYNSLGLTSSDSPINSVDASMLKYHRTESGQLFIKNITYSDQANYTCQAKTSLGHVESSGALLVRGPPDACGAISADKLTQTSAHIYWTDGADHLSRIIFNSIEGRTNHKGTWEILAANISAQILRMPNQPQAPPSSFARKGYHLNNLLLPYASYEFRVSATNEYGQGPWSQPSPKYRTEMSVPVLGVTNLRGGGGKAGTLFIRWDPVPVYAWGASEIWYHVYFRLNGTYEWARRDLQAAGGLADAYTVNVGQDNHYKLFDVMVQPVNQLGAGPVSAPAFIYSAQQMPRVQPTNVYGQAHNSTALNVTWTPIADQYETMGAGQLVGYRIRYWPSGKDPRTHSLAILKRGLTHPWGLVVGLQPNSEYHVCVMAYNEAGSGPESESFLLRTYKSAPQRSPTSVSAEFVDDTSIRITWRGVAHITTNEEPVLGYKVRYWRFDEPISQAKDQIKQLGDGVNELALLIGDLIPGETYKLRVLAYSSGGDGKMSSPELLIKVKSRN